MKKILLVVLLILLLIFIGYKTTYKIEPSPKQDSINKYDSVLIKLNLEKDSIKNVYKEKIYIIDTQSVYSDIKFLSDFLSKNPY